MSVKTSPIMAADDVAHGPRVAVIIPVFKHSGLLAEAIESVLAQRANFEIAIIVVNDGCPFAETEDVGQTYAFAYKNVHYLRKANGGLSSARNYGIDFVARTFPGYEAVYLLDADNRITPSAIQALMDFLTTKPEIGWVYPNIDKFGIAWSGNYTTEYSRLLHATFDNICEAGSLISRRVIDAGVRFDETMKSGFEDWDFWLQALDAGFKGANHPYFGFEYRQRAESMLRDSNRTRDTILNYIRLKHKDLFKPDTLLAFEHEEAPRYLHIAVGTYLVETFTDPSRPHEPYRLDEFTRRFWAARNEPDTYGVPPFLLWMASSQTEALQRLRLYHSVLWLAERLTDTYDFVAIRLETSKSKFAIDLRPISVSEPLTRKPAGWMTTHPMILACAEDKTDDWARTLRNPAPSPKVVELVITAPFTLAEIQGAQLSPTNALLATVGALRDSGYHTARVRKWIWRQPYLPNRSRYYQLLRDAAGTHAIMPRLKPSSGRLQVGMLLPVASFGGVEKVAHAMTRVLVAAGCDVHLFVLGKPVYERHHTNDSLFASINFLAAPDYPIWGGQHTYAGHELQMEGDVNAMAPDVLGLLNGLDLIVNNQVASVNAVLGGLRRRGVKIVNYVHVLDRTAHGRHAGHPYLSLAFEHVYDAILTCSEDMIGWMRSMGVPAAKLRHIVNAPSYEIEHERIEAVLTERRRADPGRPLRILSLGRFDAQKGIERVFAIAQDLQRRDVKVDWRVVGRDVLDEGSGSSWQVRFRDIGVTVLPPLYSASDLTLAFGWADVVILPSRWEGAPLTILEAQRLGCVPIATRVGAVDELVADGVDGLLVEHSSEGGIVETFVQYLAQLSLDRERMLDLAEAGVKRVAALSWPRSAEPLLDLMQEWFPDRLTLPRKPRKRVIQIRQQAPQARRDALAASN